MNTQIEYRSKIKFFTFNGIYYEGRQYIEKKLPNTLYNFLTEDLTESIKTWKNKTEFIPNSAELNISGDSKNKFVSENFNTIVDVIIEEYSISYDNNTESYYLNGKYSFDFNVEKSDINIVDIKSLLYDNLNQLYSNENFVINLDKEKLNGRSVKCYFIEIIDTPENIKFSYKIK
jgi:hypothetical protein